MVDGVKQPQLDNFVQAGMLYTLRRYQPDVLFAHLTDVDTNRTPSGPRFRGIHDALGRHDRGWGAVQPVGQHGLGTENQCGGPGGPLPEGRVHGGLPQLLVPAQGLADHGKGHGEGVAGAGPGVRRGLLHLSEKPAGPGAGGGGATFALPLEGG